MENGGRGGLAATRTKTEGIADAQIHGLGDDDTGGEEVESKQHEEVCEAVEETEVRRVLPTPDMPSKSEFEGTALITYPMQPGVMTA